MLVVAHRGGSWPGAPENTLAAVALAVAAGSDGVEVDVLPSADGELVVHHDDSLLRMTGVDRMVWELAWDEIRPLRVGGPGHGVPRLREVAAALPAGVRLALDFKHGDDRFPGLSDRVAAFATEFGRDRVTVMSIAYPFVAALAAKAPGIEALFTLRVPPATRAEVAAFGERLPAGVGISASMTACSAAVLALAAARGAPVYVWSPGLAAETEVALALPLRGVITDDVPGALQGRRPGIRQSPGGGAGT